MSRKVMFHEFGGPEVLQVQDVPVRAPGTGEVVVEVAAAGLNPVDWKLFSGQPTFDPYERSLPSGNGYDFAGTVSALGPGVERLEIGTPVFGGLRFHAQADFLVIAEREVAVVPDGLPLLHAGGLNVIGRTALASVRSQGVGPGRTVLVSGATGGVGFLVAQLAVLAGARVIGTASQTNHSLLREIGVEPIAYGDALRDAIRDVAPGGVDVVLDNVGHGVVETGIALGVPPHRINTIADYPARSRYGVRGVGGADAGLAELAWIGEQIACGRVRFPPVTSYVLDEVQAAYRHQMTGHVRGKLVLTTR